MTCGLRDYGLEPTVWGPGCEHEWGEAVPGDNRGGSGTPTDKNNRGEGYGRDVARGAFCRRCNAWRGTLGLEPTPELYVEHLVSVMREVRRVLRDDGTLWLNLGDSYAGSWGNYSPGGIKGKQRPKTEDGQRWERGAYSNTTFLPPSANAPGLKPKDLAGIPWRVAEALRAPYYTGRIRDERERIWLAAMVEAEGCLFIHKRKAGTSSYSRYRKKDGETVEYDRKQDTFGAGLEVSSTDRAIVERCMEIARIGSICEQSPAANRRRKQTIYRWNVRTNECRWIIHELYPHLVAKHHEARLLIGCPSSGSDAAAAHESLKALHQGGKPTIDFDPPESLFEPGWYLRMDVIWSKKNCMPESVRDRPTRSHEYLFLLTKSAKYAYDQEAIREPATMAPQARLTPRDFINGEDAHRAAHRRPSYRLRTEPEQENPAGRNRRSVWEIATQPFGLEMCASCRTIYTPAQYRRLRGSSNPRCTTEIGEDDQCSGTKWLAQNGAAVCVSCETFYTAKQLERLPRAAKCRSCGSEEWLSHFAVFPEKLVEPCILTTSEWGCCPECGAPWERVLGEPEPTGAPGSGNKERKHRRDHGGNPDHAGHQAFGVPWVPTSTETTSWRPTCEHGAEPVPCRVLDPFAGSGTVGLVAERLGRHSVLIDAKEEYCEMARHRTAQMGLMAE